MKKILSLILILLLLLTGCMVDEPTQTTGSGNTDANGTLQVHFIDVGQADCALLEYEGNAILIDGGNVEDSSLVVSYLEQQGITYLNLVVATHAHEDHVGGLGGVLAVYETGAVWSPTTTYSSTCFDNFMKYADQQGLTVQIPDPGTTFTAGKLTLTVLGPTQSYADPNDTSIVIMAQFGDTKFLFTGDMETGAENDMLDYWGDSFDWHADVLKVGHHGSDTSTGYRFLNEVMPDYGVISVGTGNSYGHPCEEPLSKLNDAGVVIYRTDELGTVIATSDGKTVTITWEDQTAQPDEVQPAETVTTTYIGNKNSKKFHVDGCSSLPKEENRVYFDSYDEAIEEGYTPCGNCLG